MSNPIVLIELAAWDELTQQEIIIACGTSHYHQPTGYTYEFAVIGWPETSRSAYQPGSIGGFSPAADVDFTLSHIPGFDNWRKRLLFNGRSVRITFGHTDQPLSKHRTIFTGVITDQPDMTISVGEGVGIHFRAEDLLRSIDRPLPFQRVNDVSGLTDGIVVPRGFGLPLNVTPIIRDSANGIFQPVDISGLPVDLQVTVDAVYVRARALDNQGLTGAIAAATFDSPAGGAAAAYKFDQFGQFKVGTGLTGTELGAITCDITVQRADSDEMSIGIAARTLLEMAGCDPDLIDQASFDDLDSAYSMPVERWFTSEVNALEAVAGLLSAVMGYLDVIDGKIHARRLRRPDAVLASDCAAQISHHVLIDGAIDVTPYPTPPANFYLAYDRNHTVLTDVAGQIIDENAIRAAFASTPWRYIDNLTSDQTTDAWNADQDVTVETPLRALNPSTLQADKSGVEALAIERLQLLTGKVDEVQFSILSAPHVIEIGELQLDDQIWLDVPGFTSGKGQAIRITSLNESAEFGIIQIRGIS